MDLVQCDYWEERTLYIMQRIFDTTVIHSQHEDPEQRLKRGCIVLNASWKRGARIGTKKRQMNPARALARVYLPKNEFASLSERFRTVPRKRECTRAGCINPFHIDVDAHIKSAAYARLAQRRKHSRNGTEQQTEDTKTDGSILAPTAFRSRLVERCPPSHCRLLTMFRLKGEPPPRPLPVLAPLAFRGRLVERCPPSDCRLLTMFRLKGEPRPLPLPVLVPMAFQGRLVERCPPSHCRLLV